MSASIAPSVVAARTVDTLQTQLVRAVVLIIGLLAHSYNMFGYPLFLGDEGIYMSQAWAVLRTGQLAPYTYQYDHAPAGWLLIALWSALTGGFHTFGTAVDGGRVLMLLLHGISLLLLFHITLRLSNSLPAAATASLLFALSPLAVVFRRMVLLDNIMVFWLLLGTALLLQHNGHLWPLMGSALCVGIAVLTKETALFSLPAFAFALYTLIQRYHARFARTGWLFIAISVMSLYVLFAALKKELFAGSLVSPLSGQSGEVSLLGAAIWQLSRSGGAPWNSASEFYHWLTTSWLPGDPWLLGIGALASVWSVIRGGNDRRVIGLLGVGAVLAIARGGTVLEFYILAVLPWFAINAGLLIADIGKTLPVPGMGLVATLATVGLSVVGLYRTPDPFTVNLTVGQREALAWMQQHVPAESNLIIDDDIWVDLHEGRGDAADFPHAHSHWKAARDPGIWIDFFEDNWRKVDYMVLTPGLDAYFAANQNEFPWRVYNQSVPVASFGTGDAMVEIRKVTYSGPSVRSAMTRSWDGFKSSYIHNGQVRLDNTAVQATNQSAAMLMAVWMDDRATFDQLWKWSKAHLQDKRGLLSAANNGTATATTGQTAADTDAAHALLMAANRWNAPAYMTDAKTIVRGIWQHYVVKINGTPYLAAGDWAISEQQVVFAPASFSPAAYHLFAAVDPQDDWWYLLDTTYTLVDQVRAAPLGEAQSAGLPPAFIGIDRTSSALVPMPKAAPRSSNTFDAAAGDIYWRVALDARLHNDPRALKLLTASSFLHDEWQRKDTLAGKYSHSGSVQSKDATLAMYAAVLPQLMFSNADVANAMYATKIAPAFQQTRDNGVWGTSKDIDIARIVWLSNALYGNALNDDWSNHMTAAAHPAPHDELWRENHPQAIYSAR